MGNELASVCGHCGYYHSGPCPRIKAIEYYENGMLKCVEYYDPSLIILNQQKQEGENAVSQVLSTSK